MTCERAGGSPPPEGAGRLAWSWVDWLRGEVPWDEAGLREALAYLRRLPAAPAAAAAAGTPPPPRYKVELRADDGANAVAITFDPRHPAFAVTLFLHRRYGPALGRAHALRFMQIQAFLRESEGRLVAEGLARPGVTGPRTSPGLLAVLCRLPYRRWADDAGEAYLTFDVEEVIAAAMAGGAPIP